ncbi:MAG TPA: carboxypeptidase regulatory-like domain-containing protein [Xanthomonadaceae bacterium]|nr:carboxypeptidase regulatory-like domain-containing protein [Xanthomonadaceae bacterium]
MSHPHRARLSRLSLALIAALAAAPVFAQSTSAGVAGHVVNAEGQPVAGAEVTITHVESGTISRATTDASGNYSARGLRVGGPYTITISKEGTGASTEDAVYLGLDKVAEVDARLNPDVTSLETVTVVGTRIPEVFASDSHGLGTNLSRQELDATPTPGRSIQNVARLDPRVNITDRARGEISALGQNSRMNNISVDAVGVNDPFGLEANGLPYVGTPISQDSIEEYSISTANYDVTNARSVGANINAVTKSGTNEFHGSVYYAYTDADNLTGDKIMGDDRPFNGYDKNWTAGVTFGGPIIKDKLFFFGSYEESKIIAPGPDFGPMGSGASTEINGLTQADIDRIISVAEGLGLRPGSLSSSSVNTDSKRFLGKIDWNINDFHRLSFRYNQVRETEPVLNGFSNNGVALSSYWYARERENDNYVLNLYDDWTENFSTEASISYTDYFVGRNGLSGDQPQIVINLGTDPVTGLPNGRNPYVDLGEEQFSHYNDLGVKTWKTFLAGTWYVGDHEFKGGFDYQQDKFYNLFGRTQFGAYTFDGIDAFEAGEYTRFDLYQPAPGFTLGDVAARWTLRQYGFFAQDTWQVNDNLSVQYGLRYDLPKTSDKPIYNADFEEAFGFRNDNTIDGNGVLQPRASFKYTFDGDQLMQLRGGIGLFQANTLGVWLTNPYQNNGLTIATFSCQPFASNTTCTMPPEFSADPYNQNTPPASSSQMVVDTLAPDFKQPTVWKGSLALDRQLPWYGLVASVEYQWLNVKDGFFYRNLNIGEATGVLPDGRLSFYCDPNGPAVRTNGNRCNANGDFGQAITVLDNTSKGGAHWLTFSLKKPFADNWAAGLSYTRGAATEVNAGTSSQASSNFRDNVFLNPNEEVANISNYSLHERVTASLSWSKNLFGDYATSISAFYDGHTGQPYSWVFDNDANGDSYFRDLVYIPNPGDVNFTAGTSQTAIDQFYAFIEGDDYLNSHQGGIARRNGANSPWVNQVDLSFRQELPGFMEGHKAEVRLDIYNFLNMLNSDWGVEQRVGYPFVRSLANYEGVGADGKYIYSLPTDSDGNYQPGQLVTYDDKAVSRWSVLVTLRYQF